MKILELLANYGFFSTPLITEGATVYKIDQTVYPNLDLSINFDYLQANQIDFYPDLIWARIPGTHFSVASMGKHWDKENNPKTDDAMKAIRLVKNVIRIIDEIKPKYWGIECTRGKLRKLELIDDKYLNTISLCTYGDKRMKPTDIWCNFYDFWKPRHMCKNGDPCHISAPRGSSTGSQGDSTEKFKFKLPEALPIEIYNALVKNT
jgi:hypothetical protein